MYYADERENPTDITETLNLANLQVFQSCYITQTLITQFSKHPEG